MKGVHVLLDAFSRFDEPLAELTLVGGWATRGMRHFIEKRLAADPRIRTRVGDPLPYLQEADVCVHPSFHDGLGLAPMEALACGTPVIVTEDTGMREHVRQGFNGFVIPTGDAVALFEHLEIVRTGGLLKHSGAKPSLPSGREPAAANPHGHAHAVGSESRRTTRPDRARRRIRRQRACR